MRNLATNSKAPNLLRRIVLVAAMFVLMFMELPQAQAQSYCSPGYYYGPYCWYMWITNVTFGTINNSTGCNGGYGDFSATQSTQVNMGQSYTYSVSSYVDYPKYLAIWIDWNHDGVFNMSQGNGPTNEFVIWNTSAAYNWSGSILIPQGVASGKTRMRVRIAYAYYYPNFPDPCAYTYYGEGEDYTIDVQGKQNDAGISGITSPTNLFNSYIAQPVRVTLKNFGKAFHLTSCTINWSINGAIQTPVNWTGDLDTLSTTNITLATTMFTPTAPWDPFSISAWTTNPQGPDAKANGSPDANANNDRNTASVTPILNDAGFLNADAMIPISPGVNNVILTIKNYAPKPLSYVTINYWIQGAPQTPVQYTFPVPVAANSTADVNCYQYDFGNANIPYSIKGQTQNPNGVADENTPNDTGTVFVYKALPAGTYTIGATNSDFRTMQEFADFVNFWGAAGAVTVLFRPGTYTLGQTISPRGGRAFPMTFGSVTGSSYDVNLNYSAIGAADNFLFKLAGSSNFTFQDLTFNANGANFATIFELSGGNTNITIQRCILNGKQNAPKTDAFALIHSHSNVVNGIIIRNNVFNYGSIPVEFESPVGVYSNNVQIYENSFNNFTWQGIDVQYINACQIHDNTFYGQAFDFGIYAVDCSQILNNRINGVTGTGVPNQAGIYVVHDIPGEPAVITGNTVAGTDVNGVYFDGGDALTLTDNIVNIRATGYYLSAGLNVSGTMDGFIQKNQILCTNQNGIVINNSTVKVYYNKVAISTGDYYSGLSCNGVSGAIANNFVSSVNDISASFYNCYADIYYNTFYANNNSYAVYVDYAYDGNFQRNMCYNDGTGLAIEVYSNSGVGTTKKNKDQGLGQGFFFSDGNNLYTAQGADLGMYDGTTCAALIDWQNTSGMDANSVSQPAVFMSATDLRLTQLNDFLYFTSPLGIGDEIEKVDIVGNIRSTIFYMGAHTIVPKIEIVTQPKEVVNCYGATGQMFIVVATIEYGGTLTYQWQKDGVDIPNATGAILPLSSLTHEMPGVYRCIIKGNSGSTPVTTKDALLYTLRDTKITRQPDNSMVDLGETARFDLDVHVYEDVPKDFQPKVQWYRDTVALKDNDRIGGAQSSILTIRDIQPSDYADNYSVVIIGLCGTDQSVPISISAKPKISIKTEPDTVVSVCEGLAAQFTVEAEVNMPIGMNYQWRLNGVALDNDGHFMGVNTSTLTINSVKATDAGNYDCLITLAKGVDVQTTTVSRLDVKLLPAIVRQPLAKIIVKKDAALNIDFEAQGFAPLNYAWFKNGQPTGDSTGVLSRAAAAPTDEGSYICKVWNECGEIWTKECAVTITTAIMMGADDVVAGGYTLLQNQPNPFGTTTTIGIVSPQSGNAVLSITDVFGREVKSFNLKLAEGLNNIEVNASEFSNGIYNYNLNINGIQATRRMVIVK